MEDNKPKLLQYLKAKDIIVLATTGKRPTACTVYYGIDDNFNIYIVTSPSSEHGKNIADNHQVAGVIVDSHQIMFKTDKKIGVQIYGTAVELTDIAEMTEGLKVWSKNKADIVQKYMENIKNNTYKSRPHRIQVTEIKWFNEELYGNEGVEIFRF